MRQFALFFSKTATAFSYILIFILCLIHIGCATYGMKVEQVQKNLVKGNYEDALKNLDKTRSNRSMLLYLMEKGIILHYAGRYEESNDVFDQAEFLSEDLYTKSISKEAGALLTSDNILPYNGEKYERTLIHYYKAFNYIKLNLPYSALVECRKVTLLLQQYSDQAEGKSTAYSDDAFMQYLAGAIFESQREINDAFISYRKAEEAFEKYAKTYNIQPPQSLKYDLLRLSKSLNFIEEYEQYKAKYNINDDPKDADPKDGVLIFIHENGFAPRKSSFDLFLPILKTDNLDGKLDMVSYSGRLRERADKKNYNETELEYLLRVSIPQYVSNRPIISYTRLNTDGINVRSEMVQDVEAIAFKDFEEQMPMIFLKTATRGLTKYLAFRTANKRDKNVGFLVNIFNVVTESADTRSWLSLPNNYQMIRTTLPSGKHTLQLNFYDNRGALVRTEKIDNVEIKSGKFTFLNYRTYR